MKKILVLIFIIFIFSINSWGQINTYEHELIKTFPIGNGDGEIGFNSEAVEGAGRVAPLSFSISNELDFYFGDIVNKRIVVFNQNLEYQREINWKSAGRISKKMIITDNNDIIVYLPYNGLFIIDENDNINEIHYNSPDYNELSNNNYFYYDNYIFYYDINKELKAADINNKKHEEVELKGILKNLDSKAIDKSWKNIVKEQKSIEKAEEFINQENIHMIGNRILDVHYRKHKKYYDFMKKNIITKKEDAKKSIELPRAYDILFINYDSDDNSYWYYEIEGEKDLIIIHNKLGQLIAAFYTKKYALYDIAPNGDVYVFVKDKEEVQKSNGYKLYKVTRQW